MFDHTRALDDTDVYRSRGAEWMEESNGGNGGNGQLISFNAARGGRGIVIAKDVELVVI